MFGISLKFFLENTNFYLNFIVIFKMTKKQERVKQDGTVSRIAAQKNFPLRPNQSDYPPIGEELLISGHHGFRGIISPIVARSRRGTDWQASQNASHPRLPAHPQQRS